MKKLRIKALAFSLLFFAIGCCFLITDKVENFSSNDTNKVYASYSTGESYFSEIENSSESTLIPEGNIPFSLFTSVEYAENAGFSITDYYPEFETRVENNTYYYTMTQDSAPYILLSSKAGDTPDDILSTLYSSTVHFKFNDINAKTDSSINYGTISDLGQIQMEVSVLNSPTEEPILLNEGPDYVISTNDNMYSFALNLQSLLLEDGSTSNPYVECPEVVTTGDDVGIGEEGKKEYLGGNGASNDVSKRTGLYTFRISYNYTLNGSYVSNRCVFELSFYVVDYSQYIIDNAYPLTFENTNNFVVANETFTKEYQIYNYNYEKSPIVHYDASKFALNFTYNVGGSDSTTNTYNFYHNSFEISQGNAGNNYNGIVTLTCDKIPNKTYTFYTYDDASVDGTQYIASFDLGDFEQNFIGTSGEFFYNSVYQGTYSFGLDLLTQGDSSVPYTQVDKNLFSEEIRESLTYQNLIMFGYDLRYEDKDPSSPTYNRVLPLKNEYSFNTIASYNTITAGSQEANTGNFYEIPDLIPTTNITPLKFHNYGTLTDYSATYRMFNSFNTSDESILQTLRSFTTLTELDSYINEDPSSYNQSFQDITAPGIYLMKLEYSISLPITIIGADQNVTEMKEISGCQYVLFKIESSLPQLYVFGIDDSSIYNFNNATNKNVRIAIKEQKNLFSTPLTVSYTYSSNYSSQGSSGTLSLKKDSNNQNETFIVNGETYNYYTITSSANETFSNNGSYIVTIRGISNTSKRYSFVIDKEPINDIVVNKVNKSTTGYVKGDEITSTDLTGFDYIDKNLYITDSSFTVGWANKNSNIGQNVKIYVMDLKRDDLASTSLFKQSNGEYWLTNNYNLDAVKGESVSSYANSYYLTELESNNYFFRPGLYYFFIYDNAGNYSAIMVLVDNTLPNIAQGRWSGVAEDSTWNSSYDPINNVSNFMNEDTVLYFGSHKALALPLYYDYVSNGLKNDFVLQIQDNSYTNAYDIETGTLKEASNITINFYEDVLLNLGNYIKKTDGGDLFDISWVENSDRKEYFLLLPNTSIDYQYQPIDANAQGASGTMSPTTNSSVALYSSSNQFEFSGEADYLFTLTNVNGLQLSREIHMSFDNVRSSFYAYNDSNNRYYIRKNGGTSLASLSFEYTRLNDENLSQYYEVMELYYDYYPFALTQDDAGFSLNSYPFSSTAVETKTALTPQTYDGGTTYVVDVINPDYSTGSVSTKPGKYVVTRVYRGGTHNYNPLTNQYEPTGQEDERGAYGGTHYLGQDGQYHALFNIDPREKSYTVYVDHNDIISNSENVDNRLVGNNISLQLNNGSQNTWTFKEFFKMSGNRTLITNEVPIKINIPFAKYFIQIPNGTLDYLYSPQNFTMLNSQIIYTAKNGVSTTYTIDGYDTITGMITCSALISSDNPKGELIFDKEGTYKIIITDNTGYSQTTESGTSLNVNPKSMEFNFKVDYTSPSAIAYSYIYNDRTERFEETIQDDEYGTHIYSTNASPTNQYGEYNSFYITWSDDRTPYMAKINNLYLNYVINSTSQTFNIDFSKYNLLEIVNGNLAIVVTGDGISVISEDAIDKSTYLVYITLEYYDQNYISEQYDNIDYYRFKYFVNFNLNNECLYEVTLSYDNNENYNFKQITYSVSVDRTKPSENLDELLKNETFLDSYYSNYIDSFKEENFNIDNIYTIPSALTYAFSVDRNYVLNYNDTMPYFYVRPYNKFSNNSNQSGEYASITPDMVNTEYYTNEDIFGRYPKFSETSLVNGVISIGNAVWYQAEYQNATLSSIIQSVTGQVAQGFYEIIERDYAGNYRTFTVYYKPINSNNYDILNLDGSDEIRKTFESNTGDNLTAETFFILSELSSKLGWGVVSLRNETLNLNFDADNNPNTDPASGTPITLTPYTSISSTLIDRINTFISGGEDGLSINCKYSFTLSRYNSSLPQVVKSVNVIVSESTAKLQAPTIIEVPNIETGSSTYNLRLPAYSATSVLYLTSFDLYRFTENNEWQLTQYSFDTREDIVNNNPIYGLTKGIYRVIYHDNYNPQDYEYILYVGEFRLEDFNEQYSFEHSYVVDNDTNTYYTGGNITVTYEGNIYRVYVNGIEYSNTSNEEQPDSLKPNNLKRFTLTSNYSYNDIPANQSVGGTTRYVIEYRDITNNQVQKTMNVTIFDALPEIMLTNSNNNNEEIASSTSGETTQKTNSSVRINWGLISGCDFPMLNDSEENEVSKAILYTRDVNGIYRNGVEIPRADENSDRNLVTEEGFYRLDVTNSILGNTRSVYFAIQLGEFPLYTVTDGETVLSPSPYEQLDLTKNNANDTLNTKRTILETIYFELSNLKINGYFNSDPVRNEEEFNSLVESMGYKDGIYSQSNIGIANVLNVGHYYTVNNPSITYNSNINLDIITFVFENDNLVRNTTVPEGDVHSYWTTIYLVYTLRGPIRIEFFAITKVPKTTNLLGNTIYYNETNQIPIRENEREKDLTNSNGVVNNQITLQWNSLTNNQTNWYNQGNYIYVLEKYGVDEEYKPLDYTLNTGNNRNSSTLSGAGTHKLMFKDLAGNTHSFSTSSMAIEPNVYTINLITQVIYYINYKSNDYNPIQYGIFNDGLNVVIDNNYKNKITHNISVVKNGSPYSGYTRQDNVFSFTEPGRYIVTLTGSYNGNDLNATTYTFTIVSTKSARLAFEFTQVLDYEIVQVIRDDEDITNNFIVNGKITNLFISSQDSKSGNGSYTITLKYGDDSDDLLTFSFFVNDYVPTLSSNINYGDSTTGEIVISFNPSYIYNQLGVCYVNVLIYNNDSGTFYQYGRFRIDETSTSDLSSFTLTQSNSYFIQVETENGNVISSFRVNKTDPLNSFAIIIIVVSVVAAIVLIIVVIKLRTRMKVR